MNFRLILLLAAFVGLVLAVACLAAGQNGEQKSDIEPPAKNSPGKVMDFEYFRHKYNKHYANAAELARRAKIFMARAFTVFISGVNYMLKRASKFLKVTSRSDWTRKERDIIETGLHDREPSGASSPSRGQSQDPVSPALNPSDVERLLARDPELLSLVAQLENDADNERQKRSVGESDSAPSGNRRKLSISDLIGDESVGDRTVPEKYTPSVPSNNPDYQQPEVFSEGADDDDDGEQMRPITMDEARRLDEQANIGGLLLNKLVDSMKGAADEFLIRSGAFITQEPKSVTEYKLLRQQQRRDDEKSSASDSETSEDRLLLDYRDTGCFMRAKEQKLCGSCYAFSTIALFEYHHCRQHGKLVPFSEQYIVDCARERFHSLNGCHGGFTSDVGEFVEKYGLELSADYPYRSAELACPYGRFVSADRMGYSRVTNVEIELVEQKEFLKPDLIEYMLETKGPLFIAIKPGDDFADFGGGVDQLKCDPQKKGGHAMVVVGHGIEDGLQYWLIRNSYGVSFGDQGHYKLAKDVPELCVMHVGYMRGEFKVNKAHKGKALFDQLKRKELLARFAPRAAQSQSQPAAQPQKSPSQQVEEFLAQLF